MDGSIGSFTDNEQHVVAGDAGRLEFFVHHWGADVQRSVDIGQRAGRQILPGHRFVIHFL